MKFKCGKTTEEIVTRWNKEFDKKYKPYIEWHRHFAWLPVTVDTSKHECRWLEWVERKAVYSKRGFDEISWNDFHRWEYRTIRDNT